MVTYMINDNTVFEVHNVYLNNFLIYHIAYLFLIYDMAAFDDKFNLSIPSEGHGL